VTCRHFILSLSLSLSHSHSLNCWTYLGCVDSYGFALSHSICSSWLANESRDQEEDFRFHFTVNIGIQKLFSTSIIRAYNYNYCKTVAENLTNLDSYPIVEA
jgi:hypothetical protein